MSLYRRVPALLVYPSQLYARHSLMPAYGLDGRRNVVSQSVVEQEIYLSIRITVFNIRQHVSHGGTERV